MALSPKKLLFSYKREPARIFKQTLCYEPYRATY